MEGELLYLWIVLAQAAQITRVVVGMFFSSRQMTCRFYLDIDMHVDIIKFKN